jgi:hypothetical protein
MGYKLGVEAARIHAIRLERIKPKSASPAGNSETRYCVTYDDREIGTWRVPECSAARRLLELGHAERGDRLHVYRADKLCMTGGIGWLADRTVVEDNDTGTPRFVKWRPLPPQWGASSDAPPSKSPFVTETGGDTVPHE